MKKVLLVLLLIACVSVTFVGCNNEEIPGSAWAVVEILSYDVLENDVKIGTMSTTIEALKGIKKFTVTNAPQDEYDLGTTAGVRFTARVTIGENVVLESQSLLASWAPIASYKSVDYNDKKYTISSTYNGKELSYTKTFADDSVVTDKVGVGKTYMDNEFIYSYLRTYETANLSTSIVTLDSESMHKITLTVTPSATEEKVNIGGSAIDCSRITIAMADAPVGTGISVLYTKTDGFSSEPSGSPNKSIRVPAKIVEGSLTYLLTEVTTKTSL